MKNDSTEVASPADTFFGSTRLSKGLTAVLNSDAAVKIKSAAVDTARVLLVPSDKIESLEQMDVEDNRTDKDREELEAIKKIEQ